MLVRAVYSSGAELESVTWQLSDSSPCRQYDGDQTESNGKEWRARQRVREVAERYKDHKAEINSAVEVLARP